MKPRIFSLATVIVLLTFSVSSVLFSQNKETVKPTHKNLKQSEKKVESGTLQAKENISKETLKKKVENPEKGSVKSLNENEKNGPAVSKVPMKKHVGQNPKKQQENK